MGRNERSFQRDFLSVRLCVVTWGTLVCPWVTESLEHPTSPAYTAMGNIYLYLWGWGFCVKHQMDYILVCFKYQSWDICWDTSLIFKFTCTCTCTCTCMLGEKGDSEITDFASLWCVYTQYCHMYMNLYFIGLNQSLPCVGFKPHFIK